MPNGRQQNIVVSIAHTMCEDGAGICCIDGGTGCCTRFADTGVPI